MPMSSDYEFPEHLLRRFLLAIVACVVLSFLLGMILRSIFTPEAAILSHALGALMVGWFAGKWVFRSRMSFREVMVVLWRLYRDE